MSGYYRAPVNYAVLAERISEATNVQRELAQQADALTAMVKHITDAIAAEKVQTHELKERITALLGKTAPLAPAVASAKRDASAVVIPERATDSTEGAMAGILGQLGQSQSALDGVRKGIDAIAAEFTEITTHDVALVSSKMALLGADETLRAHSVALEKWFPGTAKPVNAELGVALREIEVQAREQDAEKIQALVSRVETLSAKADALIADADALEDKQQRRMYTLKGLREVCARLGFEEVGAPKYENGAPQDRVIFAVDTRGKGKIAFRLGLDDLIETDSKMELKNCSQQFSTLADLLAEQFGIQAQFTDGHAAPRPDLKTWDAKDLPQGRKTASAGE